MVLALPGRVNSAAPHSRKGFETCPFVAVDASEAVVRRVDVAVEHIVYGSEEGRWMRVAIVARLALLLIAVVPQGCTRSGEKQRRVVATWHRGDVAIVEATAADFFEGQVLEVGPGSLKLQRYKGGDNLHVSIGDIYRLPKSAPDVAAGSWAVCQMRPHEWIGCRVLRCDRSTGGSGRDGGLEGGDASRVCNVVDANGLEQELTGVQDILAPSGLTAMNIQRRFEQSERRANFERGFREGGRPRRPASWKLAPNRMVLANREGHWFGAKIVEVDEERVVVRWDGQQGLTDLPRGDVAPQPPVCGAVARSERALRRPAGHGGPWVPVTVIAVEGSDATVEDVDRNRSTLQLRDLCPFGNPTSGSSPN